MQYAMLIYVKPGSHEALSPEEYEGVNAEYWALRGDPRCRDGGHLQPVETATSIRVQDGTALTTDGPFANTKEVFAGYYIFDVENLDQALELAARIPAARLGGGVEVRPLAERQN